MKTRLFILVCVFLITTGNCYSQGFLGMTKSQVKKELSKEFSAGQAVEHNEDGYTYFWYGTSSTLSFYAYFNSKEICFLEKIMTSNKGIADAEISSRKENSKFVVYNFGNAHSFIEGKISIETGVIPGTYLTPTWYLLWYFTKYAEKERRLLDLIQKPYY